MNFRIGSSEGGEGRDGEMMLKFNMILSTAFVAGDGDAAFVVGHGEKKCNNRT